MALGARQGNVLSLVLAQAAKLTIFGTVAGVVASLFLARLLRNLIFDVSPTDPQTFAGVSLIVIVVALIACYVPARRATRTEPMNALRTD
jgi:putative ABC transport system permease protein